MDILYTHPHCTVDKPLTFLTIYDASFELSDLAIIKRLSPYCEVLHYRRGKHSLAPNIYNGLRHYPVRISKPIPSFLRFGKFQVFVKHSGQVPTCGKCNRASHFSNVCPNRVCFNCEGLGNEARDCPCPILCCICKEEGHLGINCTYSWVCSTVSPTDEQDDVAVESDDDDGLSDCSYGLKLIRLRQRFVGGDDTVSILISDTESQLKALRVKEIEGIMIRSRAQWLEEGEQPSRYFFNLQRIKAQRSHISSVYDLNGTEVSSQEEIEKAHVDFYSRLFSEEPVDAALQDDLLSSLPRQLSSDQASSCEGQMTLDEMTFALRKMNSNKIGQQVSLLYCC